MNIRIRRENKGTLFAEIALVFALVVAGVTSFMMLYPYDELSYDEPGDLKTQEFTSDGVPVIRDGSPVVWDQQFCNSTGSATTSIRWVDVYGDASGAGFVNVEDATNDKRVASIQIPTIIFWQSLVECSESEVFAILPPTVPPGAYYRLRVETSYEPNPIREITATINTELFLYLAEGEEIP